MYAHSSKQTITDFSNEFIEQQYDRGFVFTRLGKGVMQEICSVRVCLERFAPTSENRRVLERAGTLLCSLVPLPLQSYHWSIGKMASDFYTEKFGVGTVSANKIKELMTDPSRSNMNAVFVYTHKNETEPAGYCLARETNTMIHYAYPFYQLRVQSPESRVSGMSMMTLAVVYARAHEQKFIYLGSVHDEKSLYKLQFEGLEWWDPECKNWSTDLAALKARAAADGR